MEGGTPAQSRRWPQVDPGQIVVDMESGSVFGFKLLWACVLANMTGIMFQHLCSRSTPPGDAPSPTSCRPRLT